jgi:ATP-binding cassette subfamily B protein
MPGADLYVDEEEAKTKGLGFRLLPRLWPYFRKHLGRTSFAALLLTASAVLGIYGPVLIKHAIDVDIKQSHFSGLLHTAIIYLGLQIFINVAGYFQQILLAYVGENAIADLKQTLYNHIIRLPLSFFDHNPVGRLITRTDSDAAALQQMFASTAVTLARSLVMLVGMSVVMVIVNWKLFLTIIGLFPFILVAFYFLQKRMRPIVLAIRRTVAEINNFLAETLRALPVIQSFDRQEYFTDRIDQMGRKQYGQEKKENWLWFWLWLIWDFGEMSGVVLALGVGGIWALRGAITVGGLFLFYSYISRFFMPIRNLSQQLNLMQRAMASAERMLGILDTAPETVAPPSPLAVRFSRAISFENIDFAYEGRNLVLRNVNLGIEKGEKVALVGETGSGKTSIASLLMRFYEPQKGRILLDGVDLRNVNYLDLRRQIAFVPQEVILFPGSVLDNLRLFDESITELQVHDAARRARMHARIMQMPQGYATSLIERGINLSLGERQLLAFTRALVFDPQILILDEATSSVDPQTEHLIQEGLAELLLRRTAIIIAHRLATIRMVDRIVVVHKGEIVQQGTHDALVAREGYYQRLYRLQYLAQEGSA